MMDKNDGDGANAKQNVPFESIGIKQFFAAKVNAFLPLKWNDTVGTITDFNDDKS